MYDVCILDGFHPPPFKLFVIGLLWGCSRGGKKPKATVQLRRVLGGLPTKFVAATSVARSIRVPRQGMR